MENSKSLVRTFRENNCMLNIAKSSSKSKTKLLENINENILDDFIFDIT